MLPNASITAVWALTFMATVPEYCISYLNVQFVVHTGKLSPRAILSDAKLRDESSIQLQMLFSLAVLLYGMEIIVQTAAEL